jgi:N-acetylneuraminate synthase
MSTIEEIDHAVSILDGSKFSLLHCNSSYPAPVGDLNLNCIETLKNRYKCDIGYSGHEFGLATTIASVALGATIVERHITLDRTMWGTDQMCSVEPQGLIRLVRGIRELEAAMGTGVKVVTENEKNMKEKLRK